MANSKIRLLGESVARLTVSVGAALLPWTVSAAGLPLQGTEFSVHYDSLYKFVLWLCVLFGVLIIGGMFYFIYAYSAKRATRTAYITHNNFLETAWTVIPAILLFVIFGWGWGLYREMKSVPADAIEIKVLGYQWAWQFQYDDGKITNNEIVVPVGKPVKLIMTSKDVLHGFFIPNFRIKSDVVPGMYTTLWFDTNVPGRHQVYCTAYCGGSHSLMMAQIVVVQPEQYLAWRNGQKIDTRAIPRAHELVFGEALTSAEPVQHNPFQTAVAAVKRALER